MFKKSLYVFRGIAELIKENRLYFMAPLLMALAGLSVLCYYVGPKIIITFIYAGV